MSAFMVSKNHIDALVTFLRDGRGVGRHMNYVMLNGAETVSCITGMNRIGQLLVSENAASLRYRYDDADTMGIPTGSYRFSHYPKGEPHPKHGFEMPVEPLSLGAIAKAVDCYEYQACEHPGYADSDAKIIVTAIRNRIRMALPGYEEAPWGID